MLSFCTIHICEMCYLAFAIDVSCSRTVGTNLLLHTHKLLCLA